MSNGLTGTAQIYGSDGEPLGEPFTLESPPPPGRVPDRVIDELERVKTAANDFAQAFGDSVKAQAEKYQVNPGALRRYITARVADKVEELDKEADALQVLIGADDDD